MLFSPYAHFLFCCALIVSGYLVPQTSLSSSKENQYLIDRSDFNSWLEIQPNISIYHMLDNIGGSNTSTDFNNKLLPGVVVAATSTDKPNYQYQWIRDAALTIDTLVTYLNDVEFQNQTIAKIIEHYINNNYILQNTDNPSHGLGEPKFNLDNSAFQGAWGRPQNDGPALRSITTMNYLSLLIKYNNNQTVLTNSNFTNVEEIYTSIVKPDLTYVLHNWQNGGFDLWEEINGTHFFTSLSQLKSLKKAIKFADLFEDYKFAEELKFQIIKVENFLIDNFINENDHRIFENPSVTTKNGLDIATIIGSIISHDLDDDDDLIIPFDVDNSYVIKSFYDFLKDQASRFPINQNSNISGVAIGRYPNDIYDGVGTSLGNPWFLSTAYASWFLNHQIHKLLLLKKDLIIFKENFNYYNDFIYDLSSSFDLNQDFVVIDYDSALFKQILQKCFEFSDGFLKVILDHITNYGELSEEFNRVTGFSQGATNLTWSYCSVWSAIRERSLIQDYFS